MLVLGLTPSTGSSQVKTLEFLQTQWDPNAKCLPDKKTMLKKIGAWLAQDKDLASKKKGIMQVRRCLVLRRHV